ncbi:hypothetical protein JIN77_10650 [Verrucomicrobiaceae bacterium R5-34]|uniref:Uncharacterized protein n=1 Tax=Oceaniferula flava TaxID=2800421 RepID=A0AAE2VEE2_9BACT|nr:hypothetical protein [Oceaniferula flavus]MBK1831188.1 hypothetical protein [Verrucomicrobiaceae bacterium R5-34]MBK1855704.1 hypothetical protein [Oceaniferula flavus]MBM1137010.1 hypothetical protein [Oceaniferula flavus]
MKRNPCKKVIIAVCTVISFVLIYAFHANRRPFVANNDFSVIATVDGQAVEAKLFKPMKMEDVYYIHLEDNSEGRYSWFVFSPRRQMVADPIGVYHSWLGYSYTHADQASGIWLIDAKLEDNWKVVFDGDRIDFSNSDYQVEIIRK